MPLNTFMKVARVVFVLNYFIFSRLSTGYSAGSKAVHCHWTTSWRLPASSLFSIVILFLGYRIFGGYKELCNAAERLPDVAHMVFVLNYFIVSRLPDISQVQRPVQCRWTPSGWWPASSLFSIISCFLGYRIFRGYKELCNAAECLPDVTHVVFVLNYFIVSRQPNISRVQRVLAMPLKAFLTVTCIVFVLNYFNVSRLPDILLLQRAVQCRWTPTLQWPALSLFSIIMLWLGYLIFLGYKKLLQCR